MERPQSEVEMKRFFGDVPFIGVILEIEAEVEEYSRILRENIVYSKDLTAIWNYEAGVAFSRLVDICKYTWEPPSAELTRIRGSSRFSLS